MNSLREILLRCFRATAGLFLLSATLVSVSSASSMTISGQIIASTVTITGGITLSSMTVSSLTVTNSLEVLGTADVPGNIVQMKFSTSTTPTVLSSTTYQPVPDLLITMALSNATNYIRISLTGILSTQDARSASAYLTIMRDSTDLGSPSTGLATATTNMSINSLGIYVPVGITIIDSPGDTNSHTYQVYIRSDNSSELAGFSNSCVGYLLLEEIHLP